MKNYYDILNGKSNATVSSNNGKIKFKYHLIKITDMMKNLKKLQKHMKF